MFIESEHIFLQTQRNVDIQNDTQIKANDLRNN